MTVGMVSLGLRHWKASCRPLRPAGVRTVTYAYGEHGVSRLKKKPSGGWAPGEDRLPFRASIVTKGSPRADPVARCLVWRVQGDCGGAALFAKMGMSGSARSRIPVDAARRDLSAEAGITHHMPALRRPVGAMADTAYLRLKI